MSDRLLQQFSRTRHSVFILGKFCDECLRVKQKEKQSGISSCDSAGNNATCRMVQIQAGTNRAAADECGLEFLCQLLVVIGLDEFPKPIGLLFVGFFHLAKGLNSVVQQAFCAQTRRHTSSSGSPVTIDSLSVSLPSLVSCGRRQPNALQSSPLGLELSKPITFAAQDKEGEDMGTAVRHV
jgi:hypothetical protein